MQDFLYDLQCDKWVKMPRIRDETWNLFGPPLKIAYWRENNQLVTFSQTYDDLSTG